MHKQFSNITFSNIFINKLIKIMFYFSYFVDSLVTHDGYKLEAIFTSSLLAVQNFAAEFDVIGIDEAHYVSLNFYYFF